MAQSVVGALRVNLGLDAAHFQAGARRARTVSQQLAQDFARLGAAGAALAVALGALARRGGNEIDRLAKSGRRIDTTVAGMRAMELAAGEAGGAVGSLTDAVQNVDREIAANSAGAQRALAQLRLEARDLEGLEADQKLALIADRVRALGLTSGQTSALLRNLGIRNRDMILLVSQGGDALRRARSDIEDYGLSVSEFDASAIETANDQIGRLGLVGQFAGQELARNLVPAMGRLAQTFTDSLREGGLLRGVIEGVAGQAQRLMSIALAAVGAFTAYRVALLGVAAAKWLVVGASNGLRIALLRLGLPALIIGMGEIIYQFSRLAEATGGWGNALSLLGDVARGVWDGIISTAAAIPTGLNAIWLNLRADFLLLVRDLVGYWAGFLRAIGDSAPTEGLRNAISGARSSALEAMGELRVSYVETRLAAAAAQSAWSDASGFDGARAAVQRLREAVAQGREEMAQGTRTAAEYNEELERTGGAGAAARQGIDDVADAADEAQQRLQQSAQTLAGLFMAATRGADAAKQALSQLLARAAEALANQAFMSLLGLGGGAKGGGGGLLSGLIGLLSGGMGGVKSFDGGGFTGMGARTGGLDGKGGRFGILHPNETVIDHTKGGGGGKLSVAIGFDESMGGFRASVMDETGQMIAQGFQQFNRQLPARMQQISRDPRRRG